MSVGLDFYFPTRELLREVDETKRNLVPRASKIALARVGITARKESSQIIRQRLTLKAAVVKDSIKIIKESGGRVLRLRATGKPIALKQYQARATKRGVSYKVSKARGRRIYSNKYGKSFVVAKFGNNVFIRTSADPPGAGRARIRKVFGPSVPQAFVARFARERLERLVKERFPLEFQRAIVGLSRQ